jgi:type IV pilus assembly protein PilB
MNDVERAQVEESAQGFAAQLGLRYFDTRARLNITKLIGKLTLMGMQAYGIVPLMLEGNKLTIGTSEETDRSQLESLRQRLAGYNVEFAFISQFGWNRLFNRYTIAQNQDVLETGNFDNFTQRLLNIEPKFMFEPLAQLAYQLGASDIHIEPGETNARIRLRIDGTLHPITVIPKDRYDLFASDLNMRLETIPSLHGEDVVIRLFNLSVRYLTLENLKLTKKQLNTLVRCVSHPRGLVLSVGPTGSGKTSTLYSIMNHLNNDETKIVTLEDPIEYELTGISQVPVRSDNQELFMEELRAVLREDPNIIMIGEIRDSDTAKTALQASLTGHLVLSTFHATNASAAITRMMDMIGQNPLLASSIKLIMAQRLVRELCQVCKEPYVPSKEELTIIKSVLQDMPEGTRPALTDIELAKPVGCPVCHHFGYNGRINIMEQLEITPKMEELIANGTSSTTSVTIEAAAVKDGMVTMLQDGIIKVLEQKTTLEEIYAQVGE